MKNKFTIILMVLTVLTISIASELINTDKNLTAGVDDFPIYIGRSIRV